MPFSENESSPITQRNICELGLISGNGMPTKYKSPKAMLYYPVITYSIFTSLNV